MSSCMVVGYLPIIECVGTSLNFLKSWQLCPHIFPNVQKIFHYLPIIPTANVHELIWSLIEIHEGTSGHIQSNWGQ